ncbi:MAG TPA: amidohydrolase family protein, partial [Vicinamibacterales bacterium]|nr:amidohydrolase family protein [Vicinamibacterales bacterium]
LGIDNLEHAFLASTDFVTSKQPDQCPGQSVGQQTIADLDDNGEPFKALARKLIDKKVTLTTTPAVFETFTPGRPLPPGLEVLVTPLREQFEQNYARTAKSTESIYARLFPKAMKLDLAFARMGGTLIAGTDPTGGGGVIPGYSNQRTVELLVETGFTPLEAIKIATLNGAEYLGRSKSVGSIVVGKQADLVVIAGDPSSTIADIRKVELVFKQGIGFDSARLIASVSGRVGIW